MKAFLAVATVLATASCSPGYTNDVLVGVGTGELTLVISDASSSQRFRFVLRRPAEAAVSCNGWYAEHSVARQTQDQDPSTEQIDVRLLTYELGTGDPLVAPMAGNPELRDGRRVPPFRGEFFGFEVSPDCNVGEQAWQEWQMVVERPDFIANTAVTISWGFSTAVSLSKDQMDDADAQELSILKLNDQNGWDVVPTNRGRSVPVGWSRRCAEGRGGAMRAFLAVAIVLATASCSPGP